MEVLALDTHGGRVAIGRSYKIWAQMKSPMGNHDIFLVHKDRFGGHGANNLFHRYPHFIKWTDPEFDQHVGSLEAMKNGITPSDFSQRYVWLLSHYVKTEMKTLENADLLHLLKKEKM